MNEYQQEFLKLFRKELKKPLKRITGAIVGETIELSRTFLAESHQTFLEEFQEDLSKNL